MKMDCGVRTMRKTVKLFLAFCLLLTVSESMLGSNHPVIGAVNSSTYQTLFEDDFSTGMDKWSPIVGTWNVIDRELHGSSNQDRGVVYPPQHRVGMIWAGDGSWTDYIFSVGFRSLLSSKPVEVLFRWQDAGNYYKIVVTSSHMEIWITRHENSSMLYREPDSYLINQTEPDDISIKIHGSIPTISVYHHGYPEITVKDLSGQSLASGKIGFSVEPGTYTAFRDVKVTTLHADLVGAQKVILLLVEYPDLKHTLSPEQIYANVFPTLNAYYTEVSYNQTWIIGKITPSWKMLQNTSTYYDLSSVTSSGWSKGRDVTFISDAIRAWDREVDFSEYDYVFIAGAGNSIWGYTDFQVPLATTDDGVTITGATAQREVYDWTIYAHEFGHLALGLPDLYSYEIAFTRPSDYRAAAIYVGPWDLMSRSDNRPQIGSWAKIHAGWIPDSTVLELLPGQNGAAMIQPLERPTSGVDAVIVYIDGVRYFIVENRQPVGFDRVLPDRGILISYVDESKYWRGNGPVVVQDAHPESGPRWQLPHPTFNLGPNAIPEYTNSTYNVSVSLLDMVNDSYVVAFGKPGDMSAAKTAYQTAKQSLKQAQLLLIEASNYQSPEATAITQQAKEKYALATETLSRGSLGFFNETKSYANDSIMLLQKAQQTEEAFLRQKGSETHTSRPSEELPIVIAIPIIAAAAMTILFIAYIRRKEIMKKAREDTMRRFSMTGKVNWNAIRGY
jgi:M6 family metalloprotease-like protein